MLVIRPIGPGGFTAGGTSPRAQNFELRQRPPEGRITVTKFSRTITGKASLPTTTALVGVTINLYQATMPAGAW